MSGKSSGTPSSGDEGGGRDGIWRSVVQSDPALAACHGTNAVHVCLQMLTEPPLP